MTRIIHSQLRFLLLSIFLLAGQMSVVVHSAEHTSHIPNHSCEVCLKQEQAEYGVFFAGSAVYAEYRHTSPNSHLRALLLPRSKSRYSIRAPPFSR
jgi:hypothetical protein